MVSLADLQTATWWKRTLLVVLRRMAGMGVAWGLLGAVVGLISSQAACDGVTVAANVVAWVIVMSVLGAFLAVFGGRPLLCWIGAGVGFLLAFGGLLQMTGLPTEIQQQMGVLMGAMVAATVWPWFRMSLHLTSLLWRLLMSASETS